MVSTTKIPSNTHYLLIFFYFLYQKWNLHYRYPNGIKKDDTRPALVCTLDPAIAQHTILGLYQDKFQCCTSTLRAPTNVPVCRIQGPELWFISEVGNKLDTGDVPKLQKDKSSKLRSRQKIKEKKSKKDKPCEFACHTSNSYGPWKMMHSTISLLGFEGLKAACSPHLQSPNVFPYPYCSLIFEREITPSKLLITLKNWWKKAMNGEI